MKLPKIVSSLGRLLVVSRLLALTVLTQLTINVMYGAAMQMASYADFSPKEHHGTVKRPYHLHAECSRHNVIIRGHRVYASKPRSADRQYDEMVFESESFSGLTRIRGRKSGHYLCFNKRGRLIVRSDGKSSKCHFYQKLTPEGFFELESQANANWFVGFKKNGKPLKGYDASNPHRARKCFQFTITSMAKPDSFRTQQGSRWAPAGNFGLLWPFRSTKSQQRTSNGHHRTNVHNNRRFLSNSP